MTNTMLNGYPPGTDIKDARRARRGGRPLRAFTLIEVLVVIAIMGILAALVIGVASRANTAKRIKRVETELQGLITAIDSYKSKLGDYPPDNPTNNGINQLYYELIGVQYFSASAPKFKTVDGSSAFNSPTNYDVKNTFGRDGFLNAHEQVKDIKAFIQLKSGEQKKEVSNNVFVLAVPVPGSQTNELTDVKGAKFNPWRYDATSPNRHNPKSYDLWAEIKIGTGPDGVEIIKIIGNWNAAQ